MGWGCVGVALFPECQNVRMMAPEVSLKIHFLHESVSPGSPSARPVPITLNGRSEQHSCPDSEPSTSQHTGEGSVGPEPKYVPTPVQYARKDGQDKEKKGGPAGERATTTGRKSQGASGQAHISSEAAMAHGKWYSINMRGPIEQLVADGIKRRHQYLGNRGRDKRW